MEPAPYRPAILVVEDDDLIRETLRQLFTDEGYLVTPAPDGAAAMTVLSTMRPDLVTLDLNLPGVTGGDVLKMIRDTTTLEGIKVVIISAEATIPARLRKAADEVVAKPFDLHALLALVKQLVPPSVAPPDR